MRVSNNYVKLSLINFGKLKPNPFGVLRSTDIVVSVKPPYRDDNVN